MAQPTALPVIANSRFAAPDRDRAAFLTRAPRCAATWACRGRPGGRR
ncbi:hypothetical protein [Streptomyces sviceus]|jgi:hypothetical protein